MLRKNVFICTISLVLLIGLIIHFSVYGFKVGLGATCSVTQTTAKAKVTWIHPTLIWDMIVPHPHSVSWSVSARVGNQAADSRSGTSFFMSNNRFYQPDSRTAFQKGNQGWNGDAYASSSISAQNDQDNWRFCADPEP